MESYLNRIPTYFGRRYPINVERGEIDEFGAPASPALIQVSTGIRLILGTDRPDDLDAPDILVERHPEGWVIYLHPEGGGDPSGCVYFLDDGTSYLILETPGSTRSTQVLDPHSIVPGIDALPIKEESMRVNTLAVGTTENGDCAPIFARFDKRTPKAMVSDVLEQARTKNRANDVAEYLVAARLQSMIGEHAVRVKNANDTSRRSPFQVGKAFFDVTIRKPDKEQMKRTRRLLGETSMRVWLIVMLADREEWQNAIEETLELRDQDRVVVTDIETFLCHAVCVQGRFEPAAESDALRDLFEIYNECLPSTGASGLRILCIDAAGWKD